MDIKVKRLFTYFLISVTVTIIDFLILYTCMNLTDNIIFSNTLGIVTGASIQVNLNYRYVYRHFLNKIDILFFVITFVANLLMANGLIFMSYSILNFNILVSKGISISIPFFITYFTRDFLDEHRDIFLKRLFNLTYKD